jgi:hypothetical protein
MSQHVSLLKELKSGKHRNAEAVAAIEDLEAQLAETLTREAESQRRHDAWRDVILREVEVKG